MAIVISVILLFIGISVLILIHVCVVGRTLRRGLLAGDFNDRAVERSASSMSKDDIEKLPCFDFEDKEDDEEEAGIGPGRAAECAVCLENFRAGEKCRLLPSCNHSFHAECVDLWLLRAPLCPICRAGAELEKKSGSLFGENEISGTEEGQNGNLSEGVIGISGMQEGQNGHPTSGGGGGGGGGDIDVRANQTGD